MIELMALINKANQNAISAGEKPSLSYGGLPLFFML
jgi:hypothetical protein